jgi:hypothetical protein
MENIQLGSFSIPAFRNQGTASYSVPGIVPKDEIRNMLVIGSETPYQENDVDEDEVTHEVFFGENIKRVFKTLFK